MHTYVYPFTIDSIDEEIFFRFQHFPEIISAMNKDDFKQKTSKEIYNFATESVLTALQARIHTKQSIPVVIPTEISIKADGYASLNVLQSMKLELYILYRDNCKNVSDFCKIIGLTETAARRLLDLQHKSIPAAIEAAISAFGSIIVPTWTVQSDARHRKPVPHYPTPQL